MRGGGGQRDMYSTMMLVYEYRVLPGTYYCWYYYFCLGLITSMLPIVPNLVRAAPERTGRV